MYKKWLAITLSCIAIILTWCNKSQDTLTLESRKNNFGQTFANSQTLQVQTNNTGNIREIAAILGNTNDPTVQGDIKIRYQKDSTGNSSISTNFFDIYLNDQQSKEILQWSGMIYNIHTADNKEFLRLNNAKRDMGENNAEGILVNIILDSVNNKWLLIDQTGFVQTENIVPNIYKRLNQWIQIKNILQKDTLILWEAKALNNGLNISLTESGLQSIQSIVPGSQKPILEASMQNNIATLIIHQRQLNNGTIQWRLKGNNWYISYTNNDWNYIYKRVEQNFGTIEFEVSLQQDKTVKRTSKGEIRKKWNGTQESWIVKWSIQAPIELLGFTQNININIQWLYTLENIQNVSIIAPRQYILMSQFFGDDYGIQSLFNQ